jgi:hypothetical protein
MESLALIKIASFGSGASLHVIIGGFVFSWIPPTIHKNELQIIGKRVQVI